MSKKINLTVTDEQLFFINQYSKEGESLSQTVRNIVDISMKMVEEAKVMNVQDDYEGPEYDRCKYNEEGELDKSTLDDRLDFLELLDEAEESRSKLWFVKVLKEYFSKFRPINSQGIEVSYLRQCKEIADVVYKDRRRLEVLLYETVIKEADKC